MAAFSAGAAVGLLGGMIGLGGAEFRLPLLIGLFGFVALQAVIVNKAMSLAVVFDCATGAAGCGALQRADSALAGRGQHVLAGSLVGAWAGASWATRVATATLQKVLAALLVLMAAALVWTHLGGPTHSLSLSGQVQAIGRPGRRLRHRGRRRGHGGRGGRAADPHHRAALRHRH